MSRVRVPALALLFAGVSVALFVVGANRGASSRHERPDSDPSTFVPLLREPLLFAAGADCSARDDDVIVGAYGDVHLHNPAHRQATKRGGGGFDALIAPVAPLFRAPHVTYANVEGTLGTPLGRGRSTVENILAYDAELAHALARAGVDVISTANNHALDQGGAGVRRTIEVLDAAGLRGIGTLDRDFTVTDVDGFTIAWVACTEWTNVPDRERLVLDCDRDRATVLALITKLAAVHDVVIATPHGGTEGRVRADVVTRKLQRQLVEAGARVVIGNHPHRAQQWEKVTKADGTEAFVSSCSGQGWTSIKKSEPKDASRASALLLVSLARADGRVRGVRYVPIEWRRSKSGKSYELVPGGEGARTKLKRVWAEENELAPDAPFTLPGCK